MNSPFMMVKVDVISSMKYLALKIMKREKSSSETEECDDEEDPFALITRGVDGIMKMQKGFKRFKSRNDYKVKSSSNSNSKSKKLACLSGDLQNILLKNVLKRKRNITIRTKGNKQF